MISQRKKAILRHASSIRRPNIGALKGIIATRCPTTNNDVPNGSNEYIGKDFFDDENYVSIIKCLDGGYQACIHLLECMEEYCNCLKTTRKHFNSHSKKWTSRIKQQSPIALCHTTKRAQLRIIATSADHAELLKQCYDAIQKVINKYRRQIQKMYPSERLGLVHKHYRTNDIKQSFKDARSSLNSISNKLNQLRRDKEEAKKALDDADIQCENLDLDPTATDSEVTDAKNNLRKAKSELAEIRKEITHTRKGQEQEEKNYRKNAMSIYEECRKLKQERLDLIENTLIEFVEAAYSCEYSKRYNEIYEDLMANIKTERNAVEDLDYWAKTYHVYSSTISVLSDSSSFHSSSLDEAIRSRQRSQNEETQSVTTTDENTEQSIAELDGERSLADSTTFTKSKSKKKKNAKSIERQNTNTTENETTV